MIWASWCLAVPKENRKYPMDWRQGGLQSQGTHGSGKHLPGRRGDCFASCQHRGLFHEGFSLGKPQRSMNMNHIQKMLFLYLSRCEIIIYKQMIFLVFMLFGFPTEMNHLEVLLKAFRFYWNPFNIEQACLWSIGFLIYYFSAKLIR